MITKNDEILIKRLKNGEHNSFEILFTKYYKNIYNYTIEYVTDHEIAREITQETFIRLWENRTSIYYDSNILGYLITIARNLSFNFLKQKLSYEKHKEIIKTKNSSFHLNYYSLKDEISEQINFQELIDRINSSINKLPDKCKEVFILSRIDGLKHKDIADKLNIAIKTVENHIREALKRIKKDIESYK